jgi:hypothetical protein
MSAVAYASNGREQSQAMQQKLGSTTERIYSAKQLTEALRSALSAVKEQLSVLAILDGSAIQWPGVAQALDDLAFMVDMSMQVHVCVGWKGRAGDGAERG